MLKKFLIGLCIYSGVIAFCSISFSWEISVGLIALLAVLHTLFHVIYSNTSLISQHPATRTTTTPKTAASPKTTEPDAAQMSHIFQQFQKNIQVQDAQKQRKQQVARAKVAKRHNSENKKPALPLAPTNAATNLKKAPNPYEKQQTPEETEVPAEADATFEDELKFQEQEDTRVELTYKPPRTPIMKKPPQTKPDTPTYIPPASLPLSQATVPKPEQPEPPALQEEESVSSDEDLFSDVLVSLSSDQGTEDSQSEDSFAEWVDDGLGQTLTSRTSDADRSTEAEALLKMAEEFYSGRRYSEAEASLKNYLTLASELETPIHWKTRLMEAQLAVHAERLDEASSLFHSITSTLVQQGDPQTIPTLEQITQSLESSKKPQLALRSLQALLNRYRERPDHPQMDQVYRRIESILERTGEDQQLIKVYKNHLEIKRALKDLDGESQLLDQIGNRYYKIGDKELSKRYYEENLKLKSQNS